ncbi:MAG: hypothetical protein SFV18_13830 [Bryobacteraceae bacterium]|nr:hypothetical protein [Bryobacteraceae bacterium]
MKAEVYSWRVSSDLKMRLETEAARRSISVAAALDDAARRWLAEREAEEDEEAKQARIMAEVMKCIDPVGSGDPHRSENTGAKVRAILKRKYGR